LDLPLQVGFFVYQYAKLRILQLYYDCLDKCIDKSDFEFCEMDIDDIIKPEMQDEYESDKCDWFPRTDTVEHAKYDKRTPGLFKVEWEGSGIVSLCSKTYYCFWG
jgi:hypothetical protein